MLAEQKPLFESAAETIYQLDNDPATRWLCDAHNATLALIRNYEESKEEIVRLNQALDDKDAEIANKNSEIKRLKTLLAAQSNSKE